MNVGEEKDAASPAPRNHTLSLVRTGSFPAAAAAAGFIAVIGVAMRLVGLVQNPSLSQDEAMLALNVVHRSYRGFFDQLDFLQGAPVGFLSLQKASVEVLGNHEYALRLAAFAAGASAVVLLAVVAHEIVRRAAAFLAVVAFAFSAPLITWSAWAKPYAVDVFAAVLLTWIGVRLARSAQMRWLVAYAVVSVVALWFSFASVFVLAGVATALVGAALVRREWSRALALSVASAPWVACFLVFMFTLLRNVSDLQGIDCLSCPEDFGGTVTSSASARLRDTLGEFRYVSGLPHFIEGGHVDGGLVLFVAALAFCALGLFALARRRAEVGAMLVLPLAFMVVASGLDQYPVLGRTQLFLIPSFVLTLAEGVAFAVSGVAGRARTISLALVAGAIVVAIAVGGIGELRPRQIEDVKNVLEYVGRHDRADDTIYVYYTAQYQLRYYLECRCGGRDFQAAQRAHPWPIRVGPGGDAEFAPALLSVPPAFIVARYRGRSPVPYVEDFDAFKGRRRVWFLLSSLETDRKAFLLRELDRRGARRLAFSIGSGKGAAAAYLYDFTASPRSADG